MGQINADNRNFSTISPSAKSLIIMKGQTDIPFARQTAKLIENTEKYKPDFSKKDMTFWARTLHFENRYRSIDQLMADLPFKNILELSSGFSFRGLATAKQKGYYYIDTDLPDVIEMKKKFMPSLINDSSNIEGKLELLPLNALDDDQFHEIINHFPDGEIIIINEGLLMYLDDREKEKLCRTIHKILREHGGCWITADIYIKNKNDKHGLRFDNKTKEFFEQHRTEDNKFESFKDAEAFFKKMGFTIDKEANVNRSGLSSMNYLLKSSTIRQLFKLRYAGKIQTTWRLKLSVE